jgi:hypothetical protein
MRCRSCNQEIRWAQTTKGKAIPLDVEPREDGNLVLERDAEGNDIARGFSPLIHTGKPRYVSHFATCPQANAWRKEQR